MITPKIWITTNGRCGSTILHTMLKFIGLDGVGAMPIDTPSEHWDLTSLNTRIIMDLFGMPENKYDEGMTKENNWFVRPMPSHWREWMFEKDHPKWAKMINDTVTILPPLLKDPRWSLAMPLWARYCEVVPDVIIYLTREHDQIAQSWLVNKSVRGYESTMESLRLRDECCEMALAMYQKKGVAVFHYHYPDFLLEPEQLINDLDSILPFEMDLIKNVVTKMINKSMMHVYNLESKDKPIATTMDPSGKEYAYIYAKYNDGYTGHRNKYTINMLESIGKPQCAGIEPAWQ